jgi:undecaprenyl-diphosphatase
MKRGSDPWGRLRSALAAIRDWMQRRGLLETAVLGGLFLLVASIWLFAEVADEVMEGEIQHLDERVIQAMRTGENSRPIGPDWLPDVARDLTALGSAAVITLVTVAAAGFLALRRKWDALVLILLSVAGGTVVSALLKRFFDRARPDESFHLAEVSSLSFPSGHSMLAAVTYFTLGALLARTTPDRKIKIYFLLAALVLAVVTGLTRVYLGVHFPTDVLAGWCAGIAWAMICSLATRWLERRGTAHLEAAGGV